MMALSGSQIRSQEVLIANQHQPRMPESFTNWEDEILKSYSPILERIKQSQNKLTDLK